MNNYNKDHQDFLDKTSANATQAGFDFQFYVFLYIVLNMEKNSSLEYETDDDILYVDSKGIRTLIQAKNAIQNATGSYPNLTERDNAVWHTINNWLTQFSLANDPQFFNNRKFEIWTNKGVNLNSFYDSILKLKDSEIDINEIDDSLNELINGTTDKNILEGMNKLKSLSKSNRRKFYNRFKVVQFEKDSIIQELKSVLKYQKNIDEFKIDIVYASLLAEFKDTNFANACKRDKTRITADEMLKKTKRSFNRSFDRTLRIDRSISAIAPEDISQHTFIRQLIDIEHVANLELDMIREIYALKFGTCNAVSQYRNDGDIDKTDLDDIEKSAYRIWKTAHDNSNRQIRAKLSNGNVNIDDSEYIEAGLKCYDIVSDKEIKFDTVCLDPEFTLGYFYDMSDEPRIGWRHDWESKYKK